MSKNNNHAYILSDVAICTQQCSLFIKSVAEDGRLGTVRKSLRTAHVGNVHTRSDEGLHHF